MMVVSIIGILAAVSSVMFNYYRSKSKSTEAKLALSSIFTSEEIFFNAFDMYSNCLDDMGFEFSGSEKSHYAIGFPSITANISNIVYQDALKNGLPVGACPPNQAPSENQTYYLAGNGAGDAIVDTVDEFAAAMTLTSNNLDNASPGNTEDDVYEGLGDMTSSDRTVFSAAAFGYINPEFVTAATGSLWTINSRKLMKQHRKGF